jgi:hypothetical protein
MDDFAVSNGPEILFYDGATGDILLGPTGVDGAVELVFGLTGLGDVDSDGIPDVYVGDTHKGGRGAGYVISGATGQVVYKLEGESSEDVFGDGHAAGDLDGDGVMDLIICAWGNDAAVPNGGKVFLISGGDGSTLLSIPGLDPGERLGLEAIVIEDVNADGISDYLISSGRKEVFVAAGVVL